jgi:hypothetical protein
MSEDQTIIEAHKLCKARGINSDTFIRVTTDTRSGNGYHTTNLAIAIKYIRLLDIGFSNPFIG